jgi:hypothetical protein
MTPELTDDDKAILAELLREMIARDRFPLSPSEPTTCLPVNSGRRSPQTAKKT